MNVNTVIGWLFALVVLIVVIFVLMKLLGAL